MKKLYGIRITLPENDPMRAPHLLGPDWEAYKWYEDEYERDFAFEEMQEKMIYYREGDYPSRILRKVERETEQS